VSGYGRKQSYEEEGEGYGGRSQHEKPSYGDDSPKRVSHEGGDYERPSYGSRRSDDDDEDRNKYRDGDEEGYGRGKYVSFLFLKISDFLTFYADPNDV